MRAVSLEVRNVGIIEDAKIALNKPLTIFYGEVRQGKTTLLNCMKWVCGGAFPADILRHGAEDGFIEFTFDAGTIRREFYRNRKGEVEARPLTFIKDGKAVPKPVDSIKAILNPFMLDQDHFARRNAKDRQLFLLEALGADTTAEDQAIAELEAGASKIRAELATIGLPVFVEPAPKPADVKELQARRAALVQSWQEAGREQAARQKAINDATAMKIDLDRQESQVKQLEKLVVEAAAGSSEQALDAALSANATLWGKTRAELREKAELEIQRIQDKLDHDIGQAVAAEDAAAAGIRLEVSNKRKQAAAAQADLDATKARIGRERAALVIPEPLPDPILDTTAIDAEITNASAAAVAYDRYQAFLAQKERRAGVVAALDAAEMALREAREAKRKSLAKFAAASPIPKLTFSEKGEPIYDGTSMEMLSTSQLTELQSALAGLYPEGLGVELLDRGESMGKSIFGLIDRAQKQNRTIMAAVVGDKPATVPEQVGVFVVEQGKVVEG